MANDVFNNHKEKEQMRYAKGDKVIIKSREWYDKNKDESGIITFSAYRGGCNFTKQDACFCGRVVTIKYEGYGYYLIAEDDRGYAWIDEMIEGPSTSIYNEGDIVGVYSYEPDIRAARIEEVRLEGLSYIYKVHLDGEEKWISCDDIAYEVETYNSTAAYKPNPSSNSFMDDVPDNEIKLPEGYVFKDENGNVINTTKITIGKKKKEYPKTYEECCKILDFCGEYFFTTYEDGIHFPGEDNNIYKILKSTSILTKLLICRDAYWKIAGEEMELGKSWKPDYNDFNKTLSMYCLCGKFGLSVINPLQFVFPSKEMRDEFAENFKKDIDSCNNFC